MGWHLFATEEDSTSIKEFIETVGDGASESDEDLEEVDDVFDKEWKDDAKEEYWIIVTRYLLALRN